jgi:inorganic pyrophosphatase
MANAWKDLKPGKNPPEEIDVIVEIPRGSQNKYELDKESGMIKLDRVLHSPFKYSWDYGFIPQTLADDGDPADGLIIMTEGSFPGVLVPSRPIGIMHMVDSGEQDDKIICVAAKDPQFKDMRDLKDLPKSEVAKIRKFFSNYKKKEGKTTEVTGFEDAAAAKRYIKNAIELYKKKVKG